MTTIIPVCKWVEIGTNWELTSSNFSMIMEKALKMAVVGPARVMILSGQLPSEMLMRAPLYKEKRKELESKPSEVS